MAGIAVNESNDRLLETAVAAVRAAGAYALTHYARRGEALKRVAHDIKLALDQECQEVAEHVIRKSYPLHAILGEERRDTGASPVTWIIDPIDGTVNFTHGLPGWCCSIAVRTPEGIGAGAVFMPEADELYTATADGPACCNGETIRVSDVDRMENAIVFTGLVRPSRPGDTSLASFASLARAAQKVRIHGAAAVDLCHLAHGRGDGYLETSIHLWDIAAGGLIVRRAGGRTEILREHEPERYCYLASNRALHETLRALVWPAPD